MLKCWVGREGDEHFLGNTKGGVLLVRNGVRTLGAKSLGSCFGMCWRSLSKGKVSERLSAAFENAVISSQSSGKAITFALSCSSLLM